MARILITDDDPSMRALMTTVLHQAGHTVVEAHAARAALELHRQNPVDLIVTDMMMGEMDGTELLRRVRASSPHTPIIGISGANHGKMYLSMSKMLGAECVLAKPFTPDQFIAAVNEALASAQRAREASPSAEPARNTDPA